jgi:hypothetical protein
LGPILSLLGPILSLLGPILSLLGPIIHRPIITFIIEARDSMCKSWFMIYSLRDCHELFPCLN